MPSTPGSGTAVPPVELEVPPDEVEVPPVEVEVEVPPVEVEVPPVEVDVPPVELEVPPEVELVVELELELPHNAAPEGCPQLQEWVWREKPPASAGVATAVAASAVRVISVRFMVCPLVHKQWFTVCLAKRVPMPENRATRWLMPGTCPLTCQFF